MKNCHLPIYNLLAALIALTLGALGCDDTTYNNAQVTTSDASANTSPDTRSAQDSSIDAGSNAAPDTDEVTREDTSPTSCAPQEAGEDPNVDCDGCQLCGGGTPWIWDGEHCRRQPICCVCVGADCDNLYSTYDDCAADRAPCLDPTLTEPRYPEALLMWHQPAGFAGTGPLIHVDGDGMMLVWFEVATNITATVPDVTLNVGAEAAGDLFDLLADIDLSDLPHNVQGRNECSIDLRFQLHSCPTSQCGEEVFYSHPDALQPEFNWVHRWFEEHMCDLGGSPSSFCDWP